TAPAGDDIGGEPQYQHEKYRRADDPSPSSLELQRIVVALADAANTAIDRTRDAIDKARRVRDGIVQSLLENGVDAGGKLRDRSMTPQQFRTTKAGWLPADW